QTGLAAAYHTVPVQVIEYLAADGVGRTGGLRRDDRRGTGEEVVVGVVGPRDEVTDQDAGGSRGGGRQGRRHSLQHGAGRREDAHDISAAGHGAAELILAGGIGHRGGQQVLRGIAQLHHHIGDRPVGGR